MSGKGSISRMSDECLMKLKSGYPFCGEYQAVMRKFTLARKAPHWHMILLSEGQQQQGNFLQIDL